MTPPHVKNLFLFIVFCCWFFNLHAQDNIRISVTDFGAIPNSKKDATLAIRQAINACKGKKNASLVFPKGRYDLYAESGIQKSYFISNTSSETECPSKIKTIGVLLEEMKDLTIEGEGSELIFHGKMITIVMDHCSNIKLRNISMDFKRPTMSEFTITNSTPSELEVLVHPDSWYRLDKGRLIWYGEGWQGKEYHCIRIDTISHAMYYANEEYKKLIASEITEIAPFRLRITGQFDTTLFISGNVYSVRDPIRDEVGAFLVNSKNILFKNIQMHYMHGLGIVSQYSENISMESVMIQPAKESGRRIASFADGMHFSGCKGRIVIQNCVFNGMHDDAVNVHGTHLKIVKINDHHQMTVRFMHPQSYGFNAFFNGDSIAFVHPQTLSIYAYGLVKTTTRLSEREVLITLKNSIHTNIREGDVIENISWTPQLFIRNSLFTGSNTRGLLVTTRRKVVIEKNKFYRLGMQAILIADDALSWYESGQVRDVLICNNTFEDCGHNSLPENYTIAIAPENHELSSPVHRNIRIEGNRFYCFSSPVLTARSVDGISFKNNTISYSIWLKNQGNTAMNFRLASDSLPNFKFVSCSAVDIGFNQMDRDFPSHKILIQAMQRKNLTLSNQSDLRVESIP